MAPDEGYSRAYVRRQFRISERQLKSWERQELIQTAESYSFSDLLAIQTLIKLRKGHIRSQQIARALASLRRKLSDVRQPLSELRIVSDGRKIAVQLAGQKMEAISGQILFDFEAGSVGGVAAFPERKRTQPQLREAEAWFQRGLELEEMGAPVEQAIEAYQRVLALNPDAAGALVNLGTIYYRQRQLPEAESYYRRAIETDATYPLANFNLGNLYDEQGRLDEAQRYYRRALELTPNYADAHFNLALLCERIGDNLKAVQHWKAYLKLDGSSQWAEIARRQLERLRQATLIHSR